MLLVCSLISVTNDLNVFIFSLILGIGSYLGLVGTVAEEVSIFKSLFTSISFYYNYLNSNKECKECSSINKCNKCENNTNECG